MRLMIASRNRLVGLGLRSLGEAAGLTAELVAMDAIHQQAHGADLTLLYAEALDADLHQLLDALRVAHLRFIVVLAELSPEDRQALLTAGTLYAFGREEAETLGLTLENYRWSAELIEDPLVFANGFSVDLRRRRLKRGGRYLNLTMTECQFLTTLHEQAREHPGQPVSLPEICLAVWGFPDARSATTVRGYISQLRAKVEVEPDQPTVQPAWPRVLAGSGLMRRARDSRAPPPSLSLPSLSLPSMRRATAGPGGSETRPGPPPPTVDAAEHRPPHRRDRQGTGRCQGSPDGGGRRGPATGRRGGTVVRHTDPSCRYESWRGVGRPLAGRPWRSCRRG